ncbi:MAG: Tyrosine recombinase XerD [Syntrophorhabdus sp. PtaU1.Bin050]|nr:MAG: Tyrosine recombinase XerD [Syntrophorhabdus sp. PtaU1.Bin050]
MKRKTVAPGVRIKEHPTRKHGVNKDVYFSIYYRIDTGETNKAGRKITVIKEEGLGWATQKWTLQKALAELARLKEAQRLGEKGQTLAERRAIEQERRAEEKKQAEEERLNSMSFDTFFVETYLPHCDRKKSRVREEQLYNVWLKPVIGALPFKQISEIHLERIKKNMLDVKRAERTVNYALALVRQVFNFAKDQEIFTGKNPVNRKKLMLKEKNERARFLSHEEANALFAEIKKKSVDVYRMCLLSYHTGLRASEVFTLTWSDVNEKNGLLFVKDTKSEYDRFVPMTSTIKQMFATMKKGKGEELVFPGRKGNVMAQISKTFNKAVIAIKLNEGITDRRKKIVFHSLRHSFASHLVINGVPLITVGRMLGHRTTKMTERYSHLLPKTFSDAVRVFEESLGEIEQATFKVVK